MEIKYSGPDTGSQMVYMRLDGVPSLRSDPYYPKCDPNPDMNDETQFTMCVFRSEVWLGSTPRMSDADNGRSRLYFVGKSKVPVIDMHRLEAFRSYVPATPSVNYAWAIYGRLRIGKAGSYQLCISSDDGWGDSAVLVQWYFLTAAVADSIANAPPGPSCPSTATSS